MLGVISSENNQVDVYETGSGKHLLVYKGCVAIAFSYDCESKLIAYIMSKNDGIISVDLKNSNQ